MLKYSKTLIFSVRIGCFFAFLFVFGVDLQWGKFSKMENADVSINASEAQMKQETGKYQHQKNVSNWVPMRQSDNVKPHDHTDYYQIIVDNNLFRSLGWKPPNEESEYTLIGISFDPIGDRSEAFVWEKRSNQFHIVSVGEKIGDVIIKDIAEKTVSLYKDGEVITLNSRSVGFLGSVGEEQKNSPIRNEGNNQNVRNNDRRTHSKSVDINAERKKMERMIKENKRTFKAVTKESANAQKELKQAKRKAPVAIEKKKIMTVDLELKMTANDSK